MSKGIEITTLADIPSKGTEIGSSNSVIVGLLHALYSYKGELKTEEDLAREACHIQSESYSMRVGDIKILASNVTNGNINDFYKTELQAGAIRVKITGA